MNTNISIPVEEHGEAECGCCFELLVEPTTLVCGHTFCKHCLARWTVTSGQRRCQTCKQGWRGSPKVNIVLRNMLQNAWSQKMADRVQEVDTDENRRFLSDFDKMNNIVTAQELLQSVHGGMSAGISNAQNNQTRCKYFTSGIALTVLVFCIVSYIGNIGQRTLIDTPVKQWNTDDVVTWIGHLGTWGDHFSDAIRKNSIDGKMLLVMQESDVRNRLNMTNELQRKVFLKEIAAMVTTGSKQPVNLWEYKSAYPVFTFTMLLGFKLFPRITIGYSYIFEYDTVYTPFMKYACSEFSGNDMEEATNFSRLFYIAFLPYWLVGRYASAWTTDHYWVSRFIVLVCAFATIYDVMLFLTIFMKKWTEKDVKYDIIFFCL
ncbi:bifunctional apoptosis regulator-like [Mizuhopecten yessoensis]|uniref:bifunctional apoptosis regulator-like n=1 Tax=Mizuhopecten yessoensis TaxID=6573 RepID=UPI000B459904|nr:bifunctional apoptosis regulator-like [Mizuhopecten yessoensis]